MRRAACTLLLCALAAPPARAATLDEVLGCVARNTPRTALVQTVDVVSTDRAGGERRREAKLASKRLESGLGRALLRVEAPPDARGSAFLLIQTEKPRSDMYVYLPEARKVRRITSRALAERFLGSDFGYEELERLLSASRQPDAKLGADAEKGGRTVWTVEATPAPGSGSAYVRIVSSIDQATCLPLEIAFYARAEAPRRLLSLDPARIAKLGDVHVPGLVRLRDLDAGSETRLETRAIALDPRLGDVAFSRGALARSGR